MLAIATAAAVVRYALSLARIARKHNDQILSGMTQEYILLDIRESEECVAGSNPRARIRALNHALVVLQGTAPLAPN